MYNENFINSEYVTTEPPPPLPVGPTNPTNPTIFWSHFCNVFSVWPLLLAHHVGYEYMWRKCKKDVWLITHSTVSSHSSLPHVSSLIIAIKYPHATIYLHNLPTPPSRPLTILDFTQPLTLVYTLILFVLVVAIVCNLFHIRYPSSVLYMYEC